MSDVPPPHVPFIPITERAAYLSRIFYGSTVTPLILCIPTLFTRIYLKLRPWRLGWDDFFIVVGFALAITDWSLLLVIMFPKATLISLNRSEKAIKYGYLAVPIWGLAMSSIKIGVALTFLRIQSTKAWNIFLYTIITILTIYATGNTLFNFLECRPLRAGWDMSIPRSACASAEVVRTVSNVTAAINITTDIMLSLAPLAFLHKLHRPVREKVIICILMGCGLFASVASIMKTVVVQQWQRPEIPDPWAVVISICTWTILEQFLALFAACAHSLKVTLQHFLGVFGVKLSTYHQSYVRPTGFGQKGNSSLSRSRTEKKMGDASFPSTATYAKMETDETIELGAPQAVPFSRKSAEASEKSGPTVHSAEVPIHAV